MSPLKGATNPPDVEFELLIRLAIDVTQLARDVQAVSHLRQRPPCNVQELQPFLLMFPRIPFNYICRHRVSGPAQLAAELITFVKRKGLLREIMQPDKEVVCALPRDEAVMS